MNNLIPPFASGSSCRPLCAVKLRWCEAFEHASDLSFSNLNLKTYKPEVLTQNLFFAMLDAANLAGELRRNLIKPIQKAKLISTNLSCRKKSDSLSYLTKSVKRSAPQNGKCPALKIFRMDDFGQYPLDSYPTEVGLAELHPTGKHPTGKHPTNKHPLKSIQDSQAKDEVALFEMLLVHSYCQTFRISYLGSIQERERNGQFLVDRFAF